MARSSRGVLRIDQRGRDSCGCELIKAYSDHGVPKSDESENNYAISQRE
jgi:hypothetical protein